jgi:sugar lactone lactonase YvrE
MSSAMPAPVPDAIDSDAPVRPRRHRLTALAVAVLVSCVAAVVAAALWTTSDRVPATAPVVVPTERWPVGVRTVAGSGVPGFGDGAWHLARFSDPFGVAVDDAGTVFVSDAGATHAIRRIDRDGRVSRLCGGREGFDDGDAATATFRTPSGVALLRDGRLVVADTGNNAIRLVDREGRVTTLAGDGTPGNDDGTGRGARFNGPVGVAVGTDGAIYVADTYNDRIRRVELDGRVTTIAGGPGTGFRDGAAADALFDTPSGVAVSAGGEILVADTGNNLVRRIAAGQVVTVQDEAGDTGGWFRPVGVAVSGPFVYVTDGDRVSTVEPGGRVRRIAGSVAGSANGPGDEARFGAPAGIALDARGVAWVADSDNYLVRRLTPPGRNAAALDIDLVEAPVLTPASLDLPSLPWPVDVQNEWHELTATFGEARCSPGSEGCGRLHAGVDVKADVGEIVRAVRDEVVQRPVSAGTFNSTSEYLRVGVMCYVHVRVGRDRRGQVLDPARFASVRDAHGHVIRVRVKRGTHFRVGDAVGTVNGQAHVHLEAGPPGAEVNPLRFALPGFTDTEPPVINANGITVFDEAGLKFTATQRKRLLVSGRVSIVADAYDQVDGNAEYRRLGVYAAGYQVLDDRLAPVPGFETPRETIELDRMAPDPGAPELTYSTGSRITAYGRRMTRFRYVVTNTVRHGQAAQGWWDTTTLAPGDYVVRVTVRDLPGNAASQDLNVTVVAPGTALVPPAPTGKPR